MNWLDEPNPPQTIGGERRADRRYELQLDLKWKLIRRKKVVESGTGWTLDFSSGGILFDAGRELVPGLNVELAVSWPVLLHNVAQMQLVVLGRIVRVTGNRTAIRMVQHEFRTAGAIGERRSTAGRQSPAPAGWQHQSALHNRVQ